MDLKFPKYLLNILSAPIKSVISRKYLKRNSNLLNVSLKLCFNLLNILNALIFRFHMKVQKARKFLRTLFHKLKQTVYSVISLVWSFKRIRL